MEHVPAGEEVFNVLREANSLLPGLRDECVEMSTEIFSSSSQTGTHFVLLQSLNLSETVKQVNYVFFFCLVFFYRRKCIKLIQ